MPMLTYPFSTTLKYAASAGDRDVETLTGMGDLVALLPASHFFATIYTAARSERVLITDDTVVLGIPKLRVTRGVEGTSAQAWPHGACVRVDAPILGTVCAEPNEDTLTGCPITNPFDTLVVGAGLTLDRTDPLAPLLSLAPTGVTTQSMCGATINTFGQFTNVPPNWPTTCLPIFNPCCDDAGGIGGTVAASNVSFVPTGSIISSPNVSGALSQLEAAISGGSGSGGGLTGLTAGTCITLSGTATAPTISVSPTGIAAGVYGGFAVNTCGQILSFSPVSGGGSTVTGTAPIAVAFNSGTDTYTVSVGLASTGVTGVVRLVDTANAIDPTTQILVQPTDVVTWDFMQDFGITQPLAQATTTALGLVMVVDDNDAGTVANHNMIPGTAAVTWDAMLAAAAALGW